MADLKLEIKRAENELAEMKRQSQISMGANDGGNKKPSKKGEKHDEEDEVDIEYLSSLIQTEIEDVYRVFGENDNVLEAKSSLEILMEIESRFMNLTETI